MQAHAQTIACKPTAPDGTNFVPSWGFVEVAVDAGGRYIWQYMYWDNADRLKWLNTYTGTTFEPDAFFYNYDGKAYGDRPGGYWASDLPSPYVDTQFLDPSGEKAVTIGSAYATSIVPWRTYYTVTRMYPGEGTSSWLKLSAQRGAQYPDGCTSEWCSYGCDETNNFPTLPFQDHFTVPGCQQYNWLWNTTVRRPC